MSSSSSTALSSLEISRLLGDSGAQILVNLYIGDKRLAANRSALQALGITNIVNATIDVRNYYERIDEDEHREQPIAYLRCPSHDTDLADLSVHFDAAHDFIHSALSEGRGVLVHCAQGISRSSTLTIAYLIRSRNMTVSEAYTLVRAQRPIVKPKPNFLRQLMKYQQMISTQQQKSINTTVTTQQPSQQAESKEDCSESTPAAALSTFPSAATVPLPSIPPAVITSLTSSFSITPSASVTAIPSIASASTASTGSVSSTTAVPSASNDKKRRADAAPASTNSSATTSSSADDSAVTTSTPSKRQKTDTQEEKQQQQTTRPSASLFGHYDSDEEETS